MGKSRGEAALLRVAKRFEQTLGISTQLLITPDKIFKLLYSSVKRNQLETQFRLNAGVHQRL